MSDNYKISNLKISEYDIQLMDIIFERVTIKINRKDKINHNNISIVDLKKMQNFVKAEFQASLEKEYASKEDLQIGELKVNPYDVWTIRRSSSSRNQNVVVAIPLKKSKKLELLWLDAEDKVWEVNKLSNERKIGSLSGVSRILKALDAIPPSVLMREAMNRTSVLNCHNLKQIHVAQNGHLNHLNDSQRHAVQSLHSSNFEKGFFVVQGPPGTGKTSTLVQMMLSSSATMIVTAPSNAAVANIALKLIETKRIGIQDVCVYGENSDPSVDFLNPIRRGWKYSRFHNERSRAAGELKDKLKKEMLSWLHIDENISIRKMRILCPSINDENKHVLSRMMKTAKVVLCTLNSSGSTFLRKGAGKRSLLFLDEAGQSPESEFYIATQYPG